MCLGTVLAIMVPRKRVLSTCLLLLIPGLRLEDWSFIRGPVVASLCGLGHVRPRPWASMSSAENDRRDDLEHSCVTSQPCYTGHNEWKQINLALLWVPSRSSEVRAV